MKWGMKVKIRFKEDSWIGDKIIVLRNVTEIHYNYKSPIKYRIVFESDIQQTGSNYFMKDIEEFETELETKKFLVDATEEKK